jgi:hypothetical protein
MLAQAKSSARAAPAAAASAAALRLLWDTKPAAGDTPAAGAAAAASAGAPLPRINVVGSGELAALGLSAGLQGAVHVYRDLPFDEYYDTICRWGAEGSRGCMCRWGESRG